jgi:hypothetical protein
MQYHLMAEEESGRLGKTLIVHDLPIREVMDKVLLGDAEDVEAVATLTEPRQGRLREMGDTSYMPAGSCADLRSWPGTYSQFPCLAMVLLLSTT